MEHFLSFYALGKFDGFALQLMAALDDTGIVSEVVHAELGAGQFEISISPTCALVAADLAIVVREISREFVRNYGWRSSFSPKPLLEQPGNEVHIHFSLINDKGEPENYDEGGAARLSAKMTSFCAGILHHLPAIDVCTALSIPSYFRLKPYHLEFFLYMAGSARSRGNFAGMSGIVFRRIEPDTAN